MYYDVFRSNLHALVKTSGKNQGDLAAAIGMTSATLSRYLSGDRNPDLPYVIKISKYFGVSIDWLLGISGDKFDVFPQDVQEIAILYSNATEDDKEVVRTLLKKYRKK